jgi:hypothetical protein
MCTARTIARFFAMLLAFTGMTGEAAAQVVMSTQIAGQLADGQNPNLLQGAGFLVEQTANGYAFIGQASLVNLPNGVGKGVVATYHQATVLPGAIGWDICFNRSGLPNITTSSFIPISLGTANSPKDQQWWTVPNQSQVANINAFNLPTAPIPSNTHLEMLAFSSGRYYYDTAQQFPQDLLPVHGAVDSIGVGDFIGPDHFLYNFNPGTLNMLGGNNGISGLGLIDITTYTIDGLIATASIPNTTGGYLVDVTAVPEPSSLTLMATAMLVGRMRWRRGSKNMASHP